MWAGSERALAALAGVAAGLATALVVTSLAPGPPARGSLGTGAAGADGLERATLAVRLDLIERARGRERVDARIVVVDTGAAPVDPERLADVVELARAHGARGQAILAVPARSEGDASSQARLASAVEECACAVVPEGHPLAPVSLLRGHVVIHVDERPARAPLVGKDAGASGAALALALARAAGAPAHLDGKIDGLVRRRDVTVHALADVVARDAAALGALFRGALVLVGDARADRLALHASLLHDLMHDRLLEAPPPAFTVVVAGVIALFAALAGAIGARPRPVVRALALLAVGVLACVNATAALAADDVWLPLAAPLVALAAAFAGARLVAVGLARRRANAP